MAGRPSTTRRSIGRAIIVSSRNFKTCKTSSTVVAHTIRAAVYAHIVFEAARSATPASSGGKGIVHGRVRNAVGGSAHPGLPPSISQRVFPRAQRAAVLNPPVEAAPSDFPNYLLFRAAFRQFPPPTLWLRCLLLLATSRPVNSAHFVAERPRSPIYQILVQFRSASSLPMTLRQPLSCPRRQSAPPARTRPGRLSFEFSKDAVRICRKPRQSRAAPLPAECRHLSRFHYAPNRQWKPR